MKKLILFGACLMAVGSNASAFDGIHFSSASCKSNDGTLKISATHQACIDSRYDRWNPNGCYHLSITDGEETYLEAELLRDLPHQEDRHGFYSLLKYDRQEWIENALLIKLRDDENGLYKFRLDERGASRDQMVVKAFGTCELSFEDNSASE